MLNRHRSAAILFLIAMLCGLVASAQALSTQAERTLESLLCPSGKICQIILQGRAQPAVSLTGQATFYFDRTSNTLQISQNAGAYTTLAPTSGAAPSNATYITQTAHADLSAEQALSTLSTGLMNVTTTTGVITSIANVAAGQVLTSGTPAAWSATPVVTSLTAPTLIGGTAVGSNITYKSTTGVGTPAGIAHQFTGGTDGATVITTLLNNGNVGIGTTSFGTSAVGVVALGAATAPSTSPIDIVQLWAADIAGAGTFGLNIRDEGSSVYAIGNGRIGVPNGTVAIASLGPSAVTNLGFMFTVSTIQATVLTNRVFEIAAAYVQLGGSTALAWNNDETVDAPDLTVYRDSANILAQRNGVNAQTSRGYGTFTDASNYERWSLSAVAGTGITLAAETAGTGGDNLSVTLAPAGTGNVVSALGTGGLFQVGSTLRFAVTDGLAGTGTRLRTAQATAPTCTTNCGTTPSIAGSDTSMVVTLGTGSPVSPVTVTFNGTYNTVPPCHATNRTTAANSITRVDTTTTTAVIYFAAGPTASDVVSLTCIGNS